MTVRIGTGDLRRTVRVHTGRALIATSHRLARAGAWLIGHPSAQGERVVQRPPLTIVRTMRTVGVDPVIEEWFRRDLGDGA
jgi:hypothetical protein